jgi:TPR repeat protein
VPPAKRAGSQSRSTTRKTTSRAQPKRRATSSSASKPRSTRSSSARTKPRAGSAEAQLEAAAERLRKLNERIIEAAKQTGETTLTNYEKALKSIATAVERGPGKSDIDWISNLATAQAKFIRDVTESWTSAARKALK